MSQHKPQVSTIANRHGVEIYVVHTVTPQARGIAFLVHGLSDVHDTPHMEALNRAYLASGYSTVRWDASNSWGRSGGSFWHAMATNHYDDMEDVIAWSRTQPWFREPFAVGGYSLGGLAAGVYAQRFPGRVSSVALLSPVVAGTLTLRRYRLMRPFWRRAGFVWEPGSGWPGKRYRYELIRDLLQYDLRIDAGKMTMPVLLVVGSRDVMNTPKHQRLLAAQLPDRPSVYEINGAGHVFKSAQHLSLVEHQVREWLLEYLL